MFSTLFKIALVAAAACPVLANPVPSPDSDGITSAPAEPTRTTLQPAFVPASSSSSLKHIAHTSKTRSTHAGSAPTKAPKHGKGKSSTKTKKPAKHTHKTKHTAKPGKKAGKKPGKKHTSKSTASL